MGRTASKPWFRVSKNGWYATIHGKKTSLGIRGIDREKEAIQAWHRLMTSEPKSVVLTLTVTELIAAFLSDAESRLRASTVALYRADLESFAASMGRSDSASVSPQKLSLWLSKCQVSATTKAIRLRSVSACFGWAERNELIERNPCKRVTKPKSRSRSTEAVISELNHGRLIEAASPEFRVVLTVLHDTGCRPGEAASMTAENFDPANGVVRLETHKSDRSGKARLIFLPINVVELLKTQVERYRTGSLLRSRNGHPWNARSITQAMMRLCKSVEVKGIAYGYRHSFATRALSKGIPDAHVAALLGHSSTAMLHKHYSHLTSQADVLRGSLGKLTG